MASVHGKAVAHESCPKCGSRDNLARYADGYAKCFGTSGGTKCGHYEMPDGAGPVMIGETMGAPLITDLEYQAIPARGLHASTCQAWDYGVAVDERGRTCQVAQEHHPTGPVVAQKIRYPDKSFTRRGSRADGAMLFGQQARQSHKRIVITEGEIDCLSVAQALGLKWPVVSVPDGASSALAALQAASEFLDTHQEIVLLFDQDEPGQSAAQEVAEELAVEPGKIRIAKLPGYKDPNEALQAGDEQKILEALWNAKPFVPGGVVPMADLWESITARPEPGASYPWPELDAFMYGMRRGELVTWCAGSGVGKSAFVKEIAHHLAMEHGQRVGYVALEESTRRTALDLLSISLDRRLARPEVLEATPEDEVRAAFDALSPHILLFDHFGSMEPDRLMAKLRFMAKGGGCRWLVVDHVSIVVSAMAADGDERKRLDALMTRLRQFVQQTGVGLHLVSHLRRQGSDPHEEGGRVHLGDLRGSQAIAQLSDFVIGVERNQQHENEFERNISRLRILKNRAWGRTGHAADIYFDEESGRLIPLREARKLKMMEVNDG